MTQPISPLDGSSPVIENISDTALWVAYYRAMESERPDALFRDPFAKMLAGTRGEAIVRSLPGGKSHSWALVVRTQVLDEIILSILDAGKADTVLNLAAGLDTRPYRLPLSPSTRWVEVDLPDILNYKEKKLADHKPVCRLERVRLDLSQVAERRALFSKISQDSKKILVMTEGLLVYLEQAAVDSLAKDLFDQPKFGWWLHDFISPQVLGYLKKKWGKHLTQGRSEFKFAPQEGPDYYVKFGWKPEIVRSALVEGKRLNREMRLGWLMRWFAALQSEERRARYANMTGYVLLGR